MTDILGPANASAVTTRIAESRTFTAGDSWFKPCTNAASADGTQLQSVFFNGLIAQLRAAIRGNGKMLDGVTPVIAENNTNDGMLLGAIQALIQRGQTTFGVDTGTADALVIAPSPAVTEYKAGARFVVLKNPLVGGNATTTPTIAASGLAPLTITKPDGSAFGIGDLKKGIAFEFLVDGLGNARLLSQLTSSDVATIARPKATGNLTVYMSPTGSDTTGNGTQAAPFASFYKCFQTLAQYDFAGLYTGTVQLAAGTYSGYGFTIPYALANCPGGLQILGNSANPASVVINTTATSYGPNGSDSNISCVDAINGAVVNVVGVTVQSAKQHGLYAQGAGSIVSYSNCAFGACPNGSHVQATLGGEIIIGASTSYSITGGAQCHFGFGPGSNVYTNAANITVTVTGTPAFSNGFIAGTGGSCSLGVTFSGAATGRAYALNDNAVLVLSGTAESSIPSNAVGTLYGGARVDGGAGYDWTAYNVGLYAGNGSISGSAAGYYRRVDKTIFWTVSISISSASSCTVVTVTAPPFAPNNVAGGAGRESGFSGKGVTASIASGGTQITVNLTDVSALASGQNLIASGFYPIAA